MGLRALPPPPIRKRPSFQTAEAREPKAVAAAHTCHGCGATSRGDDCEWCGGPFEVVYGQKDYHYLAKVTETTTTYKGGKQIGTETRTRRPSTGLEWLGRLGSDDPWA